VSCVVALPSHQPPSEDEAKQNALPQSTAEWVTVDEVSPHDAEQQYAREQDAEEEGHQRARFPPARHGPELKSEALLPEPVEGLARQASGRTWMVRVALVRSEAARALRRRPS
jgi:hypothetical protein